MSHPYNICFTNMLLLEMTFSQSFYKKPPLLNNILGETLLLFVLQHASDWLDSSVMNVLIRGYKSSHSDCWVFMNSFWSYIPLMDICSRSLSIGYILYIHLGKRIKHNIFTPWGIAKMCHCYVYIDTYSILNINDSSDKRTSGQPERKAMVDFAFSKVAFCGTSWS